MKKNIILLFLISIIIFSAPSLSIAEISPSLRNIPRNSIQEISTVRTVSICALRVEFQSDDVSTTTGDGTFLTAPVDLPCAGEDNWDKYSIDPAPHNNAYFSDHIRALANYYDHASKGHLIIDTTASSVFPLDDNQVYTLPRKMEYYHPFLKEDSIDVRLTELLVDAISEADKDDDIDFSKYDLVIVFHAGVGQDFAIELDPTPYDIPSAYLSSTDISNYYSSINVTGNSIIVDNGTEITEGIILPESQNHLQYDNWEDVFGGATTPCDYQIGLNGTFAFMMGFYLGLPGLYNTETGETGIGKFGLMDQGSANLNGLIPSYPSAWERYFMGWDTPVIASDFHDVKLNHTESGSDTTLWLIPINDHEYFLLENRYTHIHPGISLDSIQYRQYLLNGENDWPPTIPLIVDSVGAVFSKETGVLLSVPRYDVGLPGSGLLIWHIDESVIDANLATNSINNDKTHYGVDLEEGDGAQDLGYTSDIIGANVDIGWYFDPWFAGNEGFWDLNQDYPVDDLKRVGFTNSTNPSSRSYSWAYTGIAVDSIGPSDAIMTFRISRTNPVYEDENLHSFFPLLNVDIGYNGTTGFIAFQDGINLYLPDAQKLSSSNYTGFAPTDLVGVTSNIFAFSTILSQTVDGDQTTRLYQVWQINDDNTFSLVDTVSIQTYRTFSNLFTDNSVLLQVFQTVDRQTRLMNYVYQNHTITYYDLEDGDYKIVGSGDGIFLINCDNGSIRRVVLNSNGVQSVESLTENVAPTVLNAVVGYIDVNAISDIVIMNEDGIELLLNPGSIESEANTYSVDCNYGDHLALGDIDGDDRVEILLQTGYRIYAFNQQMLIENNFPIQVPNLFRGDMFANQLLTNDMDGDGVLDIITTLEYTGIVAFNQKGDLLDGFPISTTRIYSGSISLGMFDNALMIMGRTYQDERHYYAVQIEDAVMSDGSWNTEGGNRYQNYYYSVASSDNPGESSSLLNNSKTFNWPNPTENDRTAIRYYPTTDCDIDITVYDLAGNFIKSFSDSNPVVNEYNEIEWNVSTVANGVYFAVVKASNGSKSESKIVKIMVIH